MAGIVSALEPNPEAMRRAAEAGFATATDLADYLVRKGVPFRDAHAIVGQAVALAIEQGIALSDVAIEMFKSCRRRSSPTSTTCSRWTVP